jgi:hypothetical protein
LPILCDEARGGWLDFVTPAMAELGLTDADINYDEED